MVVNRYAIKSREQWLDLRKQDVTASDAAALFADDAGNSLHPYRTALGLYEEKRSGESSEIDSGVLRRGRYFESAVAVAVGEELEGSKIEKCEDYFSDREARVGATPDFWIETPEKGRGILQAKTVERRSVARYWTPESPPPHVVIQTLIEVHLTGVEYGVVGALVIDPWTVPPPAIYMIPRHDAMFAKIVARVAEFWEWVEAGTPPPADFARDGDLVSKLYSKVTDKEPLDLTGDNRLPELLSRREELKTRMSADKSEVEAIDTELKDKLGGHESARAYGWSVTWKEQTRKEHMIPASTFRVLRCVRTKTDKD